MKRLLVTVVAAAAAVVTATATGGASAAPRAAAAARMTLPTDHLALGVALGPDDAGLDGWLPSTGVPFDYGYQYLAGGVDTGQGWQTWNDGGQFPVLYARDAASRGVIPVFSYYMLQQSKPQCVGCGEAQRDLAGLNSPSTMRAWYADLTTLFQRLATFDGVSVVQLEPDLSGFANQAVLDPGGTCYGYCTGSGDDPSLLKTAVASSGDADLAGLPNTFAGWAHAVVVLRDRYAPRVKVGFHVSSWAPASDVGSQHETDLNPVALGTTAGTFAKLAGAGSYDLTFNDVADRDAGYYEKVYGQDRWWDQDNVRFPNFHRWERFVAAVHATVGRPLWIWQIPVGNQVMRSENNTDGHYQDNRLQYLLTHVDEVAATGVTALLFGAGNPGSTVQHDGKGDGVTNPAPVCDASGSSSGSVCTSLTATSSDDDGGYLRTMAKTYYAHPFALAGSTAPGPARRTISATPRRCTAACTVLVRGRAPGHAKLTVTSTVKGHPAHVVAHVTVPATGKWSVRVHLSGIGKHVLRAGPVATSVTIVPKAR